MKRLVLFLFLCVIAPLARAQSTPYHYTIQGGISAQLIYCIEQDASGRLLLGTDKGLYRYNGFKSTRIAVSGNYSKEITQLAKNNGRIFAANRSGQLFELKNDKLKALQLEGFYGDIREIAVNGTVLTITGSKYITTYRLPACTLIEQEVIPFTEPEATLSNSVLKYKDIRYAVLNSGELVEIEEGASRSIPNATGKQLVVFDKQLVIIPGHIAEDPVYSYNAGRFRSWGPLLANRSNLKVNNARVIGNQLLVLSENGVFVYTNALSKKPAHWFRGIATTDVFRDAQGNTWISTKGKGLLFIPAGRHEIVYDGSLLTIESGPRGTFFGGNLNGSIVQFDAKGRELKRFSSATSSQEALFVHFDPLGQLLFSNTGLFTLAGKEVSAGGESVKGIARSSDGTIYMAKSSGVTAIPRPRRTTQIYGLRDSTRFAVLRREPGKSVIVRPKDQALAISTVRGVFWRATKNDPLTEITFEERPIDAQSIAWFNDDLVIATSSNELLLVREGRVVKRKDLSINSGELVVLKMLASATHVYILTEKGMYRFSDLDQTIESLKELIGFDGLVMRDFALSNELLYVATQRGVLRFSWKQEEKAGYSLVLGEISGRKYKQYAVKDERLQIPFDEKLIVIPFECVDLSGNQQFIVRYAIHTTNERGYWNSLPASAEQLNLSHLNPAEYTVEFYLYDPVSQTKSAVQRKKFTVLYDWHNRPYLWWFISLLCAFFLGLTWRWTLRRQKRRLTGGMQES